MLSNYSHRKIKSKKVAEPVADSGRPSRNVGPSKRFQDFDCYHIKTYKDVLMGSPSNKKQEIAATVLYVKKREKEMEKEPTTPISKRNITIGDRK